MEKFFSTIDNNIVNEHYEKATIGIIAITGEDPTIDNFDEIVELLIDDLGITKELVKKDKFINRFCMGLVYLLGKLYIDELGGGTWYRSKNIPILCIDGIFAVNPFGQIGDKIEDKNTSLKDKILIGKKHFMKISTKL